MLQTTVIVRLPDNFLYYESQARAPMLNDSLFVFPNAPDGTHGVVSSYMLHAVW
jgi:hypothetical protein